MKRGPQCERDLRSIHASLFAAFGMPPARGTTIPRLLPYATERLRGCGWPGCPRCDVGEGSFIVDLLLPHKKRKQPLPLPLTGPQQSARIFPCPTVAASLV